MAHKKGVFWYPSENLTKPLEWNSPRFVFVEAEVFHEGLSLDTIKVLFNVMSMAKQHTFQVATACSERLLEVAPEIDWPSNVWIGVFVRGVEDIHRIHDLVRVPAMVHAVELQAPISSLPLKGIEWLIVQSSKTGDRNWLRELRDQCHDQDISFFLHSDEGRPLKLDGKSWCEVPDRDYALRSITMLDN